MNEETHYAHHRVLFWLALTIAFLQAVVVGLVLAGLVVR